MGKAMKSSLNPTAGVENRALETVFHAVYGSPLLQALDQAQGLRASPRHRPGVDAVYRAFVAQRIDELTRTITRGGPREAAIRALLYIRMPEGIADERGFHLLRAYARTRWQRTFAGGIQNRGARSVLHADTRRATSHRSHAGRLDADLELGPAHGNDARKLVNVLGVESKLGKNRSRDDRDVREQQ